VLKRPGVIEEIDRIIAEAEPRFAQETGRSIARTSSSPSVDGDP
jgi:hypothetical protein